MIAPFLTASDGKNGDLQSSLDYISLTLTRKPTGVWERGRLCKKPLSLCHVLESAYEQYKCHSVLCCFAYVHKYLSAKSPEGITIASFMEMQMAILRL